MILTSKFELKGLKVLLTVLEESDITDTYIDWLNDPEVVRFSNQRFVMHDRASCLEYLASFAGTDNLFLNVRRLDNQQAIGTITAYVSKNHGTADVGILIGEKYVWGQGYGQDAWNTLTNWLIEQDIIRKITAGTLSCNRGMITLMERSEMTLEAVRYAQEVVDGQPEDILLYAKFSDTKSS